MTDMERQSEARVEHTAGPWAVATRVNGGINGAWIKAGELIVARIPNKADRPISQKEADAALIAAAPDLLAAVRDLDKLSLVIESAVRDVGSLHRPAIVALIHRARTALSRATR